MARGDMDEPRPERSYLLLSDRELYLDELDRSKDQINLRQKPIVVLNMCESAQVTPSLSEGFIPFFLEQGASAVVGTECPMTTSFGHPFAEALFYSLLRGDSLGEALLKARRKFLQPGEFMAPLGLAYTLYGPATLRYQPPLLMDPSAGVDGGRA
jgi:CHAT domain-containing protein